MFTQEDLEVLAKRGISVEKAESQLKSFETGFPYLKLKGAASPEYGILVVDDDAAKYYQDLWQKYLQAALISGKQTPQTSIFLMALANSTLSLLAAEPTSSRDLH